MKASVNWHDGLHFTGIAASGFPVEMGGNAAGVKQGASPMEMLLMSLAGCTGMDVISILQKKRQDVAHFQIHVDADRAETYPMVFTHIRLHFVVSGRDIDANSVERAIELSRDKYCSVSAMLSQGVPIEHTYEVLPVGAEPTMNGKQLAAVAPA